MHNFEQAKQDARARLRKQQQQRDEQARALRWARSFLWSSGYYSSSETARMRNKATRHMATLHHLYI